MKKLLKALAIGLVGSFAVGISSSRADLEVAASVQISAKADFYQPLSPHGAWIEVGSYGRCWRPAHVAVEWRPYCYGHWVWTDCGWYWASDEPWGWACYHYGSWVYDPVYFWVWVPAIEWAPAWVSWRVGGGYIGWAPLPPHGVVVATVPVAPFVFVETHRFREPLKPGSVIVNNTTIINKTTVINNMRAETRTVGGATRQKVMINEGPGVEPIQKAVGKTVSPMPIREAVRQTPAPSVATRSANQPKAREQAPVLREQPKSAPEQTQPPVRSAPPTAQPAPSQKHERPDEAAPGYDRPSRAEGVPGGHGRGHGKGREEGF